MRLEWRPEARSSLVAIRTYIAERDPLAAGRVNRDILACAKRLKTFPQLGRVTQDGLTRLLQVPGRPYMLPYRLRDGIIEILDVFDARRERPEEWQ